MWSLSACDKGPIDFTESRYPENIHQIVTTNCAVEGCHIGATSPEGLDLSTWGKAFAGGTRGAVLVPYSADWSHFFQHLNTYSTLGIVGSPVMPPATFSDPLSEADVTTIRTWIEMGAPNLDGNVKWTEMDSENTDKLFVLCAGNDLVAVVNRTTNLVTRYVPVGQLEGVQEAPHFIIFSPDKTYFYITFLQGGIVEKYRVDNYELVGRVAVGSDPALMTLNPAGTRMVVSHWNDAPNAVKLTMVNTDDMSVVQQVTGSGDLLSFAHGIKVTSDFRTLYVAANQGNYVSKYDIDETGFLAEAKIPIEATDPVPQPSINYKPYDLYMTPDESRLFITCSATDEVRVLDLATEEIIAKITVGDLPRLMTFDSVSNRLFVACGDQESFADQGSLKGCVSVVDMDNLTFIKNIYQLGHRPHGVSVDYTNRRLYVASENVGGVDPPHHPVQGTAYPPGKFHVVDLNTLEPIADMETEVAEFPNALIVAE